MVNMVNMWFDITQWCVLYWFFRFIFVLVIYRKKREKDTLYVSEAKTLPVYKKNTRDCLIYINISINGITTLFVILHQTSILGA